MNSTQLSYETIKLGELVDVRTNNGWSTSVKVHFFNRKGVLIGRRYEFLSYEMIYRRNNKSMYVKNLSKRKRLNLVIREFLLRKMYDLQWH